GHSHFQSQPRLVAFGTSTDDSDRLRGPELIDQPWRTGGGGCSQVAGPHDGKGCRRSGGAHNKASAQSRMAASATVASTRFDLPFAAISKHRVASTSMRGMMPPVAFDINSRPSSAKTSRRQPAAVMRWRTYCFT